jgi:hypothetical protein
VDASNVVFCLKDAVQDGLFVRAIGGRRRLNFGRDTSFDNSQDCNGTWEIAVKVNGSSAYMTNDMAFR